MKGIKLPKFAKGMADFTSKNASLIMAIAAVGGVALTAVTAFKSSKKAAQVKEDYDKEMEALNARQQAAVSDSEIVPGEEVEEDVAESKETNGAEKKEVKAVRLSDEEFANEVKRIKRNYIVGMAKAVAIPVVLGITTCGLIIGSHHVQARRLLYMTTAYEAATGDLKKYKDKIKEVVGQEKSEEVEKEVTQEKANEAWQKNSGIVYQADGGGDTLFYDKQTAIFFRSNQLTVETMFDRTLIAALKDDGRPRVSDFYDKMNLPVPELAEEFYFKVRGDHIDVTYGYTTSPSGEHAISIEYDANLAFEDDSKCFYFEDDSKCF